MTNLALDATSDTTIEIGYTATIVVNAGSGYKVPAQSAITLTGATINSYTITNNKNSII